MSKGTDLVTLLNDELGLGMDALAIDLMGARFDRTFFDEGIDVDSLGAQLYFNSWDDTITSADIQAVKDDNPDEFEAEEILEEITFDLTASADSVEEGKSIDFTVTASEAVTEDTEVTFNIVTDGYDAEEADFQSPQLTQTATILEGETTATFSVNPPQDGINEETETFGVSVSVDGQTLTADSDIIDIDSREFVLTTGRDVATANIFYASQTQYDVDGQGPTLQTNDILTGFADRTDNKLIVTDLTPGVANSKSHLPA